MTRKDYRLIAQAIGAARNCVGIAQGEFREGYRIGINNAVEQLCEALRRDNPRFDIVRFMAATNN